MFLQAVRSQRTIESNNSLFSIIVKVEHRNILNLQKTTQNEEADGTPTLRSFSVCVGSFSKKKLNFWKRPLFFGWYLYTYNNQEKYADMKRSCFLG